jgi:glycosyltransferase involved in cell wall biosynthesis
MLVTIVVPCHRQAHFLREALESALAQTYSHIEIVVVDDAATDGALAEAISGEFGVRFLRTPRTVGPGPARNAAIAATAGTYVLPLDADDIVAPDYVERAVAILVGAPELGVVYCDTQGFGPGGSWTWEPPTGWTVRDLIAGNRLPNSSLYRRACWEHAGGYPTDLFLCEDWDFWVRIARVGWGFTRIPEYLYFKRHHDANLTHQIHVRYDAYARQIRFRHRRAVGADRVVAFDTHAASSGSR